MEETGDLTELQLALLRVLWDRGEATVAGIHEEMKDRRGLAHSTIATLLSRLERRALIDHKTVGRQFLYRALVTEHEVRESALRGILSRLFDGSASAMVAHLVGSSEVDVAELTTVKRLIQRAERERTKKDG